VGSNPKDASKCLKYLLLSSNACVTGVLETNYFYFLIRISFGLSCMQQANSITFDQHY